MDSRTQALPKGEIIIATLVLAFGITLGLLGATVPVSRQVVVAICAAAVAICVLVSPLVGLCLTVMAVMVSAMPWLAVVPKYASIAKVLAITTAFSLFFRLVVKPHTAAQFAKSFRSSTFLWYAVLAFWPVVLIPFAIATTYDQLMSLSIQVSMVGMVLLFATIPNNVRELEAVILGICVGAAILGIYTFLIGDTAAIDYAHFDGFEHGTYNHDMARAMAIALIASMIPMTRSGWVIRLVLITTDVALCLAICLTLSRGTWVALIVCMLLPPFVAPKMPYRYRVVYFCVLGSLGLVSIYLLSSGIVGDSWSVFLKRAASAIDSHQSASRLEYAWPASLAFIKSHLLIGGGLGAQRELHLSPHNIILRVLMESGITGLVFFGLFVAASIREAVRNTDPILRVCSLSIITFWLVAGQFSDILFAQSYAMSLGILACLANLDLCKREGSALPFGRHRMLQVPG